MPRFCANRPCCSPRWISSNASTPRAGFAGVEYLFPYDVEAEAIKARLEANGLEQVLLRGIACHPDREFREGV